MIKGSVSPALEAILRLTLRRPADQRRRFTAVIDTGYNGALTLPSKVITGLGLPWIRAVAVVLGDGSMCDCDTYAGIVIWDGHPISIVVDEANTTPLVGMELLHGFELNMKVQRRGQVTIKPLRRR